MLVRPNGTDANGGSTLVIGNGGFQEGNGALFALIGHDLMQPVG
jgi:hypothetical protein